MTVDKGIKIQNIYHMLAYAFQVLKQNSYETLGSERFENTADLLAAILTKGISLQLRRGLGQEYIPMTDSVYSLRGKIDISQSIKEQTMRKKQLICNFDEFSINTKMNQIIKTTVCILIKSNIPSYRKKPLKSLLLYFDTVDVLNPYTIDWAMNFHRNNQSYQMLINICYLVIKGLLQTDEHGDMKMAHFLDEQRMCRLYEKFILEYYKREFPQLRTSSSQIKWQLEEDTEFLALLPTMQTDIMLSTKDQSKTLIIDAKYYANTMQIQYDKPSLHSSNLYQIFAYVKNAPSAKYGNVSGMLLYAKTDESLTPNAEFNMSGNRIYVKTLDLSLDFDDIRNQLNNITDVLLSNEHCPSN